MDDEELKECVRKISENCKWKDRCDGCVFHDENEECILQEGIPSMWEDEL